MWYTSETNLGIKNFEFRHACSYIEMKKKLQTFIGSRSHSEVFYGADETRDITSHKKTSLKFLLILNYFGFEM